MQLQLPEVSSLVYDFIKRSCLYGKAFFFAARIVAPPVPERSAGMEAKAGRANSLVFGGLPQANGQKAAQVFMEKIKKLQYTVFKKGRFL